MITKLINNFYYLFQHLLLSSPAFIGKFHELLTYAKRNIGLLTIDRKTRFF